MVGVTERPVVGFIGLGTMGSSIAMNLVEAGLDLAVHDLRESAAGPHLAAGARWMTSPAEVAATSDVVLLSLPGPSDVTAVLTGPSGVAEGARRPCSSSCGTSWSPKAGCGGGGHRDPGPPRTLHSRS